MKKSIERSSRISTPADFVPGIRPGLRRIRRGLGRLDKVFYEKGIRSAKNIPLPDCLGIGFPKAGTTWLYENLRQHPEAYVTRKKEVNYFTRNYDKSLSWYSRHFEDGSGKKRIDITPGYAHLPAARIRFIRKICPNVRLVMLLRDPVEQQWSSIVHKLLRSTEIEVTELKNIPESKFIEHLQNTWAYKAGGFTPCIDRWLDEFPREQLFVGMFDDVGKRPKALLTDIFRHMGLSCDIDWDSLPYEKMIIPGDVPNRGSIVSEHIRSQAISMPPGVRSFLENAYSKDAATLKQRFNASVDG